MIFIGALGQDAAVEVDCLKLAAGLHVGKDGISEVFPGDWLLSGADGCERPGRQTNIFAKDYLWFCDGFESGKVVDDQDAIVNVDTKDEAKGGSVEHDSRGRGPSAIGFSCDKDSGTSRSRHPEARTHTSEYGDGGGVLYYARGYLFYDFFLRL